MTRRMLTTAAVLALAQATFAGGSHAQELATATFADGCFWCVEADFDHVPGGVETVSGYTGGTGHHEAVRIAYDPSRVS